MSDHAKNIIGAVVNQDPIGVKDAFDQALSQRILDKIGSMYPNVSASIMDQDQDEEYDEDSEDESEAEEE